MALLDICQRPAYLFTAITVGHIVLISVQVNADRGIPALETITFGAFAEVQRGVSSVVGGAKTWWDDYLALRTVRGDNERLRQEMSRLQIALQQERALARQSRWLEQLLELRSQAKLATVAARVIAGSASPDFRTLTIDKGTNDGLGPDMAVIAPRGVVGRVITPGARAAKVQLLIDRNAAAGAVVERSRSQGIVEGTGGELRLNYVSGTADVKVGDVVVTSGIEGIYPKGFVVGQIESVASGSGAFGAISIRPAVDFSSLEGVLVVLTPPAAVDSEPAAGSGTRAPE